MTLDSSVTPTHEAPQARNVETRPLLLERRLIMRLMAHWWGCRGTRRFPGLADFDPEALSDIWPSCFTFRPNKNLSKSRFLYVGEAVALESGADRIPKTVAQVHRDSLLDHATRNIESILSQKVPVVHSGDFRDPEGRPRIFRSILLPLSEDQETIDCVVGGARCKPVAVD